VLVTKVKPNMVHPQLSHNTSPMCWLQRWNPTWFIHNWVITWVPCAGGCWFTLAPMYIPCVSLSKLVGPVMVGHNPPVPARHDTALEKNWESKGDPKEPHAPPCIWLSGPGFQDLDKRTLGFSTSTHARTHATSEIIYKIYTLLKANSIHTQNLRLQH
jgi:hypothetical protein